MRITSIKIQNKPPIDNFEATNLSTIIVLAGPNGIGKTRLIQQIIGLLQNPQADPSRSLNIEATSSGERDSWKKKSLNTLDQNDSNLLRQHLQKNRKRGKFESSILNFDSSRTFEQIAPFQWSWNFPDPFDEDVVWNLMMNPFKNRYQDTIHALYRKIGHYRTEVSQRYEELRKAGKKEMPINPIDPLEKFKTTFDLLLFPKKLADIPLNNPVIQYIENGQLLSIDTLSSGEREVFTVVFDLLLHDPKDCIIFFDEPEVHLHPELSFRLLRALENVGERNQFIFCTHSPDIITQSLNHSVIFIKPKNGGENQAVSVFKDDEKAIALNLLGQNLGVIALGKKIVLIEGSESSLDKQTYGEIMGSHFPQYVLVPSGSRQTILSFSKIVEGVLSKSLWGIDFFMISDHDSSLPENVMTDLVSKSSNHLAFLPRYHLENYFLDEEIIARMVCKMEPHDSWLCDPVKIRDKLKQIARESIPYTIRLELDSLVQSKIGNVGLTVKGINDIDLSDYLSLLENSFLVEQKRVNSAFSFEPIKEHTERRWIYLNDLVDRDDDEWKKVIPGRTLFNKLSSAANVSPGRFKTMYINQAKEDNFSPFEEIIQIFEEFEHSTKT
ncbi:MAG: AAA family ATPase [Methanoregula sp.]|jgi:ABC-type multidrug transport system ATPase subunit|uniref:AAA family ATPase n=1 Tax=Methanoregula sp. TaxID=2052170 RepID=UPI0025FC44EB|nr:AAA family ATPase [Methanoregula sp.]MCK9630953.1 AAA family ATPase [Methanoregula sp.]